MFSFIVGILAALFGLGLGIGALMAVLAPLLLLALLPLLPILLVVAFLRHFGVIRGRLASFVVVLLGIGLLLGAARYGWTRYQPHMPNWVQACTAHDGQSLTLEPSENGLHFSCRTRPASPPKSRDGADI